ncbi:hypothetical protein B0T22DRAFT_476879 [Podospora appendiculata]|uniref:Uncharacterized protein n=1 Tax=Podospora appendiculata TaxID=314037 RepID=A0AAE0XIP9_9PEZI|nr:hypothetical protein B0T22DRAFT_476879 [Podospora appendiculata]
MSAKPTLSLSTPRTANFPNISRSASELHSAVSIPSAVSERTPLSAISRTSAFRDPLPSSGLPSAGLGPLSATIKLEYDLQRTPITPPVAYLDFLKGMSLVSPSLSSPAHAGKGVLNRTSTASSTLSNSSSSSSSSSSSTNSDDSEKDEEKDKGEQIESAPSTARTDVSCECDGKDDQGKDKAGHDHDPDKSKRKSSIPAPINTKLPPSPRDASYPLSAPAAGHSVFPSMKLPASPAVSTAGLYSPRSPLSAASVRSPFDWDAALKSRRFPDASGSKRPAGAAAPETPNAKKAAPSTPTSTHAKRESRSSIRHIREVVTRTVTYTPRMGPAPKGKRRKLDSETAVES